MVRALRRRAAGDESGIALIMVIGVTAVLAALLVASIAYATGQLRAARNTQDWSAAMAAAYAGVEEYQSRIANDTTYFQYGNPAATFGHTVPDTRTLPPVTATNPAFGVGATGSWANVSGSGGKAQFRYEVDNSKYSTDGTLRLRATGRAGGETRSIVADLKQQGFIDFLYFTDYEIADPQITGDNVSTCVKYAWAGRPSSGCSEIAFGSNDVVNGPAHSNDAMRVCAATFKGAVTTGYYPSSPPAYIKKDSTGASCTGQVFSLTGYPLSSPVISMPPTNSELKKEVRTDLTVDVPRPGCLYTGPTSITFTNDGKMTVRSPWTKKTQVVGSPATSGTAPAQCGTPGSAAGSLGSSTGQSIAVPDNNVIYVQNVPTVTSDPNYSSTTPSGLTVSTGANGSNGIGFPTTNETTPQFATASLPAYGYKNGDVFVKGTLSGRVTVASENYVYVTGDMVYKDKQADLLGLVGNNAVWVWNPMNGSNKLINDTNRNINAAILSVAHTFQVQNYNAGGERGSLNVYGAIAQKFRGIVHSGSNGYIKGYSYDERFRYTAPPKFLSPVTTTYGVNVWVETDPAFRSDGTYR
ncbi:hypothetical protein [Cellulomonas sp. HZM]|uniref:hypothetical protein n=1 Tax=Cellulomonas sp. HZM TaxID=1454010 RepID=UPI0004934047|nr:hypothetical protein [Cellulomonas sp. HZM]